MKETNETPKSHRMHLSQLKADAIQDYDDALNDFLNDSEPQKHTETSVHQ